MHTFTYKGYYIHANFTFNSNVTIQTPNNEIIKAKSVHSAKILISRMIKRG